MHDHVAQSECTAGIRVIPCILRNQKGEARVPKPCGREIGRLRWLGAIRIRAGELEERKLPAHERRLGVEKEARGRAKKRRERARE
jgi:hypothetical protein